MKQEMGLFASKNKGVDKECVDPFTFTVEIFNSLELNKNEIKKQDKVFLKLVSAHADVNEQNSSGETLLHIAASRGYVHSCQLLLQRRAEVNHVDNNACTPLIISCFNNHSKVIKLLLKSGADPNILTPIYTHPPIQAVCDMHPYGNDFYFYGKPDWGCRDAKLLIQHGADVNLRNIYGETTLHYCCKNGTATMVDLLIRNGADLNCRDKCGYTPLHLTIVSPIFVDLIKDGTGDDTQLCKLKILIKAGADLSINTSNGDSHYHLILQKVNNNPMLYHSMLFLLLKHDPKLDRLNVWGQNCLHVVKFRGGDYSIQCDIVKQIVHGGISVNAVDDFGNTPLHYVCNNTEVIDTLMELGSDINVRNNHGKTPLQKNLYSTINLDKASNMILKHKASVDTRDYMGKSLLHYAMVLPNPDEGAPIISLLLNAGCQVNTQDNNGMSCLHMRCMDILLQQPDIDVNIRDYFGSTPLHLAAWEGRSECVKKLLSASGIDLNMRDSNNRSVLDVAAQRCNLHIRDIFPDKDECSFGPHLRIDACTGDVHPYIGDTEMEVAPFLQQCLQCPDLGSIWNNDEAHLIKAEVDCFVRNLVTEISIRYPHLQMDIILSGSVSEETKCGLPDEFDYMIALGKFTDICQIVQDSGVNVQRPGYVLVQSTDSCPPQYEIYFEFATSNILKNVLYHEIHVLINKILDLKILTSSKQLQIKTLCTPHIGPNLEIELTWKGAYYKNLPVKIDFVPVLKFSNWCPDNLNVHSCRLLTPSVIQEVGCDVTLLNHLNKATLYKSHQLREKPTPLSRMSCSRLELNVFQTIDSKAKQGYILAKCILFLLKQNDPINRVVQHVEENYYQIIESYMLKTALFYILDDFADKGVEKYSAVDICERIYDYIFDHTFKNESGDMYIKMATYFLPDVFIESLPFEPYEKKLKFGLQLHSIQGKD